MQSFFPKVVTIENITVKRLIQALKMFPKHTKIFFASDVTCDLENTVLIKFNDKPNSIMIKGLGLKEKGTELL